MRARAKIVASALLAAGLIAGCAPQPGTAAVVDGHRITVDYLDDGMALGPYFQQAPAPSNILASLIQARAVIDAAGEHGVGISTSQAAEFLEGIGAGDIAVDGEYPDAVLDIVRMELISQELQSSPSGQALVEQVTDYMENADIEFNPRYGEWDISQGGLVQTLPDWIEFGD